MCVTLYTVARCLTLAHWARAQGEFLLFCPPCALIWLAIARAALAIARAATSRCTAAELLLRIHPYFSARTCNALLCLARGRAAILAQDRTNDERD